MTPIVIATYATRGNARRIRVILEEDGTYSYAEFHRLRLTGRGTAYPTRADVMDAVRETIGAAYRIDGITFRSPAHEDTTMQAIVTKFLPPTNHRGSRIKATCQARSLTLSWDHAWNPSGNHRTAAQALATQLGWHGRWICSDLPSGETVWMLDDPHMIDAFTVDTLDTPWPSDRSLNRARKRAFAEPEVDGMGNRLDGSGPLSE